jgi:hypothetical protein
VRLEVIDRATDEALNRMIELGLVSRTTRATRPLFPMDSNDAQPAPLTDAERQQAATHRQQAARKIKVASLLGDGGLQDEARTALLEALLPLGRALAIENRVPEPTSTEHAMLPPLSMCWKETLPTLRTFLTDATAAVKPIAERLATF